METIKYRKLVFGPPAEFTILSLDDEENLIALAVADGSIMIYSEVLQVVHSVNTGVVTHLQFVKGKGCLIALSITNELHFVVAKQLGESLHCQKSKHFLSGASVSHIHMCRQLANATPDSCATPILVADTSDEVGLLLVTESGITNTTRLLIRPCLDKQANKILRIAETDYNSGKLTVIILWNDIIQLVRFSCHWNDQSDVSKLIFDIDNIICCLANSEEMNNLSVITQHKFLFTTSKGEYGTLAYRDGEPPSLVVLEVIFPYGPFPCKSADKCMNLKMNGIKEVYRIFSGGLPAVTYRDLNTLSVTVRDEPEICFTFYDTIVDFDVVHRRILDRELRRSSVSEIIVVTKWEVISICNNRGTWESSNKGTLSTMSRSHVLATSNIINMDHEYKNSIGSISGSKDDNSRCFKLFATFTKDSRITIWRLADDQCRQHTKIDIASFFGPSKTEKLNPEIMWPRFQRCGLWKNDATDCERTVNALNLIWNGDISFKLLCSIDGCFIFCFEILLDCGEAQVSQIVNTTCHLQHISISAGEESRERKIEINEEVRGIPKNVELEVVLYLNDMIDLSSTCLKDFTISFGGIDGIGLVQIPTGKSFYISTEDLAETSQRKGGFSELILTRLMKRKTFESSNLKNSIESKSTKSVSKTNVMHVASFHLYPETSRKYDLVMGFNNGLVMILSLSLEDSGEISVSKNYRRLPSKTKDAVMLLFVINYTMNLGSTNSDSLRMDSKLGDRNPTRRSFDSTKEGSLSSTSKSTHVSSDSNYKHKSYSVAEVKSKSFSMKILSTSRKNACDGPMLLRCDARSIKMIDYLKLKTRFKYKVKPQPQKPGDINEGANDTITQVKIVKNDNWLDDYLILLLNNGIIIRLSLPNLEPISSSDLQEYMSDISLLSIDRDVIVIPQNITSKSDSVSEFIILDERTVPKIKKYLNNKKEYDSTRYEVAAEKDEIDFMKGADTSTNSLWL